MKTSFSTLPDYMSTIELEKYFNEFIEVYTTTDEIINSLEELDELAERQWHTYEIISDGLKAKIENFTVSIINYESYEIMDLVLVVIPKLGLQNTFSKIVQNIDSIRDSEVIELIREAEKEYGKTVSNPYSGM